MERKAGRVKEIQVTDEMLYQYMPVVDAAIMEQLENRVYYEHEFSKKFERKMKRLIRREAHPWLEIVSGVAGKAAVVFAAFAGVSLILTMSVEAYRLRFFEKVKTLWEDSFLYSYIGGTKEDGFRCGIPAYIPDGYTGEELENDGVHYTVYYTNEKGNEIVWSQTLIEGGEQMVFDSEYDKEVIIEIEGAPAIFHLYESGYLWIYYERDGYVFFVDSDALEIDEMVKILESIKFEKQF